MTDKEFQLPAGVVFPTRSDDLSDKTFSRFKLACFEAARRIDGRASRFSQALVSPSFHQAEIRFGDQECSVVCSVALGYLAMAKLSTDARLAFVDQPDLAKSFKLQGYKVLSPDVLALPLTAGNCANLDESEMREIEYWKCNSVGDVLFNWFD